MDFQSEKNHRADRHADSTMSKLPATPRLKTRTRISGDFIAEASERIPYPSVSDIQLALEEIGFVSLL